MLQQQSFEARSSGTALIAAVDKPIERGQDCGHVSSTPSPRGEIHSRLERGGSMLTPRERSPTFNFQPNMCTKLLKLDRRSCMTANAQTRYRIGTQVGLL